MNTLGLHPVYKPKDPSRRFKGIAMVVALHLVLGWPLCPAQPRMHWWL